MYVLYFDSTEAFYLAVTNTSFRMRLAGFASLFSLLSTTTWAQAKVPTKKPSNIKLEWLRTGVGMKITFADNRTDEIFLKRDSHDNCLFQGSLKSDIQSEVEVDGCKGDFEFVEISSRLVPCGLITLLYEDGETYEINPLEGMIPPDVEDSRVVEVIERQGQTWSGALPATAVAKIHVRYDTNLLEMVGGQHAAAKKKVNKIIKLARPYFRRSNGLAMDIEIEVVSGPSHYNERMNGAPQDWLNWLNYQGGSDEHPTAWFTATKDDWQLWSPRINGYSNIGAFCVGPGLG